MKGMSIIISIRIKSGLKYSSQGLILEEQFYVHEITLDLK
jgi:hypothetical protein